jgi:predicted dehydrogenase
MTRRDLLKATAAAAAFTIVPRHVLGGPHFVPPSERVNVAVVGVGGQGYENVKQILQENDARIIAVADPFEDTDLMQFYYKCHAGRGPISAAINAHYQKQDPKFKCAAYEDFRVMLEKEKAIDAVLCATPDHLHAYVSITAMKQGKHVYCEKPLTHNLWETREVARVAKETGVATQMGNLGHSRNGMRQTVEWIKDGAIGPVREVHAWVSYQRWNPALSGRPTGKPALPAGANWDLWLGPREGYDYNPAYAPVSWRDFWAFGGGGMGDFGCHDLDAAMWALDLETPRCVEAMPAGVMTDDEIAPQAQIVYYDFPARGNQPPVKVTFYDGGLKPPTPEELGPEGTLPGRSILFIGDKGKMLVEGAGGPPRLLPYKKTAEYKKPAPSIPRVKGSHQRDWLDAVKGVRPASSHFETAAKLTELVQLGILAVRTKKRIYWDAQNMKAQGVPEADPMIHEKYRKGWEIA